MTKLMKLSVIALLTGTLALVGCGDDETNGTGATGGEGATGGGGSGGSGGIVACEQTCGVGNVLPTGPEEATAEADLTCSLENAVDLDLPATFQIVFRGVLTDGTPLEIGDNSVELSADSIVSADTSAFIFNFAAQSDIEGIVTVVRPILGASTPAEVTVELEDVPCVICWSPPPGVPNSIVLDTTNATYAFPGDAGDSLILAAEDVTITVDVEGVGEIALTTTGDTPDCFWGTDIDNPEEAPSISFAGPTN